MARLWDNAMQGEPTRHGNCSQPELHWSSQQSEIPRPNHSSTIGALFDSNLLVRLVYLSIGSHTNQLVHYDMGREIVLRVRVFSDFFL